LACEVELTLIPEEAVAVVRERGPLAAIGDRMRRLRAALDVAGVTWNKPMMARFYEDEMRSPELDYDVCVAIRPAPDGSVPDHIGVARGEIVPAHYALVATHVGPHDQLARTYAALTAEAERLGYAIAGPPTEVYVTGPESAVEPATYVTQIRLPIAR
jgi:effector-binding domain-containing protein